MPDYGFSLTRTAVDSDIVRVRPNTLVQVYRAGTSELVVEVLADAQGYVALTDLALGHYDLRVDGNVIHSLHHVPADHTHLQDRIWTWRHMGAVSASFNEDQNHEVFATPVAGSLVQIDLVAERAANLANIVVHVMRGSANGSDVLTTAGNSVWQYRIRNDSGATIYRWAHHDLAPAVSLTAGQSLAVGVAYTAAGVSGLMTTMIFRPNQT